MKKIIPPSSGTELNIQEKKNQERSYIIHLTQPMVLFNFSELSSLLVMDAWHAKLQLKFLSKNVTDGWIYLMVFMCCFAHSWRRS